MSKRRIRALLLCVLMLTSVVMMCACNNEPAPTETTESGNAVYSVTVVDGSDVPYTEKIIVKFMQGVNQVAMVPINEQGVAKKELAKGDYSVVIASTDSKKEFYYDSEAAKLTADQTEIKVVLANEMGESFESVNAPSLSTGENLSYEAYYVEQGCTHVPVTDGDRSYFLFVPKQAGTYELSVANNAAAIGIYGASIHYITGNSVQEVVDNKITISVTSSMIGEGETGTTIYVIGLDAAEGIEDCVLNVIRTGDAEWSFTEEPWAAYQPAEKIEDYTLSAGISLKEFDLTAASGTYHLVLNEEDGFYHVNAANGPRVFVQLADEMSGISMMNMVGEIVYIDGVLQQTGSAPFRYSYNNGQDDFFKEDYTDVMRQYVTCRDENSGVYPLNADLYYILPKGIESMGWCREETANYLFKDVEDLNPEYSWMFLLMYEDLPIPDYVPDTQEPTEPAEPTEPTEPEESVPETSVPEVTEPAETEPQSCSHNYREISREDATCTDNGTATYACSECGMSYTEQLSAKGHDYAPATCTEKETCKHCGAQKGKALGHTLSDATCTKPATCSVCGVTDGAALGHDYAAATCTKPETCHTCGVTKGKALGHNYVAATCTEPATCKECAATKGKALGHDYVAANCTTPKTCRICAQTSGEPLGHSYRDATCTTAGICANCHESSGEALGHSYVDGLCERCGVKDPNYEEEITDIPDSDDCAHDFVVTAQKKPSCTTKGEITYTCTKCDESYVQSVAANGHEYQAATCTEPETCKNCGKTNGAALGHNYSAATCTKPATCKVCKATKGKALGHSYSAATCTKPATCKVCKTTKGKALGHDYSAATCTKPATCKVCKTTKGKAVGHKYSAATCTKAATCKVCKATKGKALGHDYSAATCTKPATCKVCKVTKGTVLNHNYSAATCSKPATCTFCGATTGGKTPHTYGVDFKCTVCGTKNPNPPIEEHKDAPIEIASTLEFDAQVKANHLVYYNLYRVTSTTLRINNKNAYVIYDGVLYSAVDGVVTLPNLVCPDDRSPVTVAIGNNGTADATFAVTLTFPAGHRENPKTLNIGTNTTNVEEGNDQGVYYTYTVTQSGKLTIKLNSVSNGKKGSIAVEVITGDAITQLTLEEVGGDTITVDIKAGDRVKVIINTVPVKNKYPAATIVTTVSIT